MGNVLDDDWPVQYVYILLNYDKITSLLTEGMHYVLKETI